MLENEGISAYRMLENDGVFSHIGRGVVQMRVRQMTYKDYGITQQQAHALVDFCRSAGFPYRDMRSKQQVKNAENVTSSTSQCDATNVTSLRRVREEKEKRREEKNRAQKPTAAHEPSYGSHEQYETDDQPWMHDKTVLGNL